MTKTMADVIADSLAEWPAEDSAEEHAVRVAAALSAAGFGLVADAGAKALEDAADDPKLRLSGHSGISITRLRARAVAVRGEG